jgi:7-cyano-7-deazaguanine reductase
MDLHARRSHLRTADNPETRLDYVVFLEGSVGGVRVRVRYVPDRRILIRPSLEEYFEAFGGRNDDRLEFTATTILHDLNNELVARWVQVSVSISDGGGSRHQVTIEDRQPKWDNPGLLARLTAL